MRVAHVISSPRGVGGAERVLAGLLDGGLQRGWDQIVLHPFAQDGGRDVAAICRGVPHRALACNGARELPRVRARLREELEEFRADVVHSHLFHAGVAVASVRRRRGELRVWSHHHGSLLRDHDRRIAHALERWSARRYDVVVAVSDSVRRFVVESCGVPDARVRVVRNGWQGEPSSPDTSPRPPTVVCVGNFREEKDHATLLRAVALVRRDLPSARLLLIGDGPLRSQLDRLVDQLGLRDGVHFEGAVSDVWPHLAAADVFALSSTVEPLGIAVLEAMAAGVPTVTTDVGGIPEVVEDGRTGLLVPMRDPQALASALATLLVDGERRASMSVAARARAATMRADDMVAAYADVYAAARRDLDRRRGG